MALVYTYSAMAMSKAERVFAALSGDDVDRVPVSAWWHDFGREWSAEGLAEATVEGYRKYDWDFIKVNPRATYYAEDWGTRYVQAGEPGKQPALIEPGVTSAEGLRRIQPLDIHQAAYGEQLEGLRIIGRELGGEAPFIQTVFSPLAVMSRITGSTKFVQKLMAEHSHELMMALKAISDTLSAYSRACLDSGASGIFFATVEWGSADNISLNSYDMFCRPFDMTVLDAVREAPFNVFHVCRNNNHLRALLDYPVAAFNWDVTGDGNPSLAEIMSESHAAVMGGVSHEKTVNTASPAEVAKEAQRAIIDTGGRRFLLTPGCSVDPQAPEANLRALVQVPRS